MRPPHAVQDKRIFGREHQRFFDELEPFGGARRTIDKRIAERIECLGIVRFELDQLFQARLDLVEPVELFGDHRDVVEKISGVRVVLERAGEQPIRALVVGRVAQKLRLCLHVLGLLFAALRFERG